MKLKKIVGALVALGTMSLMCVCAQAATTYKAGIVKGEAGANVTVPITAECDSQDQVNGYVMTLTYDPSKVTPVVAGTDVTGANCYATAGDAMKDGIIVSDVVKTSATEATLAVSWAAASPVTLANGSTELAKVNFSVNASATESIPVQVAVAQLAADSATLKTDGIEVAAGQIDLGAAIIYGDVDRNGTVQPNDIALVRQYYAGLVEFDADQIKRADVDGNSSIQPNDIALIRQYYAKLITVFPVEQK